MTDTDRDFFSWSYDYPVRERKNFTGVAKIMGILLALTFAIIAGTIALGAPPGEFLASIKACLFVFWIIAAVYVLSFALSIILYKGVFCYSYESDGNVLIIKSKAPYDSAAGAVEETLRKEISTEVYLNTVRKLKRNEAMHAINIRGTATVAMVYASDDDYENVWNYLTGHCVKAKIK